MSGVPETAVPDVTVIVGAYNAMPYMTRCVMSVVEQTIGDGRVELVAVDDGSTDGTGAELDRLAEKFPEVVRVVHQANSGGPSAPRNAGLDLARGRYVFFLDADDHLGPEALERMVAMADAQGSDVVLGKMVGIGGRNAPRSMFRRNQPKADLFASRVYWTLSPLKLFRREMIERLGLRFRTDLRVGEDQPFVAMAYLRAAVISVVADYDCYYWVEREDGNNVTLTTRGTHPRLRFLSLMFDLLSREVAAGPNRDLLVRRHLEVDLNGVLHHLVRETDPERRESAATETRRMLDQWYTDEIAARLAPMTRLRLHLAGRGMLEELREVIAFDRSGPKERVVVDGGRAFGAYPYFRDPSRAVPDSCYDITDRLPVRHRLDTAALAGACLRLSGHAYIDRVDTREAAVDVILRERGSRTEYRFPADLDPAHAPEPAEPVRTDGEHPTAGENPPPGEHPYDYGLAGFSARIDIATAADGRHLPRGLWDVHLRVRGQGIEKEVRVGNRRAQGVDTRPLPRLTRTADGTTRTVTPYYTTPQGDLTLDVGQLRHPLRSRVRVRGTAWAADAPGVLVLTGHADIAGLTAADLVVRAGRAGHTVGLGAFQTGVLTAPGPFELRVDLARAVASRSLETGEWELSLVLPLTDAPLTFPVPDEPGLPPARFRQRALPAYAKPLPGRDSLTLRFGVLDPVAGVRRRLRIPRSRTLPPRGSRL